MLLSRCMRRIGAPSGWLRALRAFHGDERGAEGLEKLLILAAVALPLLGLLIAFRNNIRVWVEGIWEDVRAEGEEEWEPPDDDF